MRIDAGETRPVWVSGMMMGSDVEAVARLAEFYRANRMRRGKLVDPYDAIDTFEIHHMT